MRTSLYNQYVLDTSVHLNPPPLLILRAHLLEMIISGGCIAAELIEQRWRTYKKFRVWGERLVEFFAREVEQRDAQQREHHYAEYGLSGSGHGELFVHRQRGPEPGAEAEQFFWPGEAQD